MTQTDSDDGGCNDPPSRRSNSKRKAVKGLRLQMMIDPIVTPKLFMMVKKTSGRSRTQRVALLAEQALTWNLQQMTDRNLQRQELPGATGKNYADGASEGQAPCHTAHKGSAVTLDKSADMLEGVDFG